MSIGNIPNIVGFGIRDWSRSTALVQGVISQGWLVKYPNLYW